VVNFKWLLFEATLTNITLIMLVMIGVHGGITLVLRADLHTLTARHIPVHGKTRACMALASTDSWAGGLPHVERQACL